MVIDADGPSNAKSIGHSLFLFSSRKLFPMRFRPCRQHAKEGKIEQLKKPAIYNRKEFKCLGAENKFELANGR